MAKLSTKESKKKAGFTLSIQFYSEKLEMTSSGKPSSCWVVPVSKAVSIIWRVANFLLWVVPKF